MSMVTLRSRLSFARRLLSSSSRGSSSSRKGFTAATARRLGDLQVTVQNAPPGKTPRASAPPRGPVVMPKQTAPPSKSGPSVSFGAPPEEEMSISASEGEQSAAEAGASAAQHPSAVAVPSEADAELSAMPPPILRGWMIGFWGRDLRHRCARLQCPSSRRCMMSWSGRGGPLIQLVRVLPPQPSLPLTVGRPGGTRGSLRLSVRLRCIYARRTPPPGGALRASRPKPVYQAKALKELHKGSPDQAVLQELRAANDFALRATKVTAWSLGQVMSTLVRTRTRSQHSPAREPGKKVGAAQCSQIAPQDVHPSGTSPLPLSAGRPTAVTSVNAPLIPLAARLVAWLELPSPSRWLIRTVRLGYAIQFVRHPPKSRGVLFTSVRSDTDASVLRAEIAVLLAKDAIEPGACPSSRDEVGVLQPLLHRAQEERLPFKMLTSRRILSCVRHQDWFAAIDLKDAYFHVSILPRHRPFLRFAFEGRAYQYKVLPFGLSLSPRVFTKVAEGALNPLWRKGVRILNYLDDWLIMAHSRDLLCEHRDLVLQHLSHLGLRVNREKSKLSPVQRISFLGMELDSVNMTACLTNERTQSVLNCLKSFRHKTAVPLKTFQRLLGHMAAAAVVTLLGLLHMRPLQRWLHDRVPRWAWHRGTLRIGVSPQCRRLFSPWSDPAFLRAGVPLGQVSRHVVVYTEASTTGWGAVCNGQAASGSWTGPRLLWHINCLELLAVLLALRQFLPMLRHKHVLVRTDNTATVVYINRQGGLRSHRMSQLACHLLLWSQTRLKSLRAVHMPGELNRAADQLSRQPTHLGEWQLHPQTVQLIWSRFGEAQIDLFASPESSHCQLYYSLSEAPLWNLHMWLLDGTW
ncbi:ORF V: Enzymatic polyprotein [Labeo rohita]|uniref:ribonuclease H n=1 Tax=Labeo rohita TaxID=84645 RepID=A0ABQ8LVI8_LABRO|nr:ORF V: Enzymatic polyprotein [Labeo rohita]